MGLAAESRFAVGMDVIEEADRLCRQAAERFPRIVFFAGKVVFRRERWYHRLLHNDAALTLQKRLLWDGLELVVVPVRVH